MAWRTRLLEMISKDAGEMAMMLGTMYDYDDGSLEMVPVMAGV